MQNILNNINIESISHTLWNVGVFVAVLLVLVMIHELGHFVAAKLSKMRVEEFAFGFPPKLFSKKIGETNYAFNLLPLGGYVKITGESFDPEEREILKKDIKAFQNRPRILQLFVLFAGVFMNIVLAIFIFFVINKSSHLIDASNAEYQKYVTSPKVYVASMLKNSPAETAGLKEGDQIISMSAGKSMAELKSAQSVVEFVKSHNESAINIVYSREVKNININRISTSTVSAVYGLVADKKSVGMAVIYGQHIKLGYYDAARLAILDTYKYTKMTIVGLGSIFTKLIQGENVMDSLSGPVGIAKMVGNASSSGSIEGLLFIIALLSINLAVFNILPLPALDGGRILFVLYEAITRRAINYKFQYYANAIGFLLLISLMIITTYFDIIK